MLDPDDDHISGEGLEATYRAGGPADEVEGRSPTEAERGERCSICRMEVTATDHVAEWPGGCGHACHMVCLMEHLARRDDAARCPPCDADLQ
eukprot:784663-Alexandrium_andersonii.AAC.1